jgi:hypothetical protein
MQSVRAYEVIKRAGEGEGEGLHEGVVCLFVQGLRYCQAIDIRGEGPPTFKGISEFSFLYLGVPEICKRRANEGRMVINTTIMTSCNIHSSDTMIYKLNTPSRVCPVCFERQFPLATSQLGFKDIEIILLKILQPKSRRYSWHEHPKASLQLIDL